ncbi:MAG TPA: cupin domain-containing protein [Candidatus Obscuribacterales bacterium]
MTRARVRKGMYSDLSAQELQLRLSQDGYSIFAWRDAPGTYYPQHSHPHDEFIVVVSGSIVFEIAGSQYELNTGDALELPAGTVHAAVNRGSTAVSYFICTR